MDLLKKCFRLLLDLIAFYYGKIFYPDKKGYVPPIDDQLLLLRATEISDRVKRKLIKAEDVIKAYLKRIEQINPLVNSVIQVRNQAIDDARDIDERLAADGDDAVDCYGTPLLNLPLLGVPFTCKDSVSIRGMGLVTGLMARKDIVATDDATVIRNLRRAGAIPIALTNIPELLLWWDAHNNVFGRTKNPYDASRIPGGSAGGDAASLCCCSSLIAVGSDLGGSIRIPAYHCGVFGHKATSRVIPIEGKYPPINPEKEIIFSFGPMTRYASDLKPMLKAMAGPDIRKLAKIDLRPDLSKLIVYYMEGDDDPLKTPLHPEMLQALRIVVTHLKEKFGINCVKHNFEEFKYTLSMLKASIQGTRSVPMSVEMTDRKGDLNPFIELIKFIVGLSNHTLGAIAVAISEKITPPASSPLQQANVRLREELKEKFRNLLGDKGVFLYPSFPEPPCKHGTTLLKIANVTYQSIFNVLDVPTSQCPVGLTSDGLPLGVQVVSNPQNDHYCLAIAEEIEKAFGGWTPPFLLGKQ